ncbi:hypothetical protein SDJN03_01735, partial [Cucurbita argyrosperma subsp. sororia]
MVSAQNESFRSNLFQVWQKSGRCPKGTIPIRRVRKEDLLRANSFKNFGKKFPIGGSKLGAEVNRSTAILVTLGYNYIGATGEINVWNPMLQVDSYKSTGCFDLTCSGFVQTNPMVGLGGTIEPMSSISGGQQFIIAVGIFQDPQSGNWWLKVQNQPVGYWPPTLFGYLSHSATLVEWGGEVFSSELKKVPHTGTAMGSGDYAGARAYYASFVSTPRIVDYSLQLKYPERVGTWADEPTCYSVDNFQETYTSEPVFYYGGPGRSRDCH